MRAHRRYDTYRKLPRAYRLDKWLTVEEAAEVNPKRHSFETVQACISEDRKRIRLMQEALDKSNDLDIDEEAGEDLLLAKADDAVELMKRLTGSCDLHVHCGSLASSLAFRSLRLSLVGEVLRVFDKHDDGDIVTFTVLNEHWVFTPEELLNTTARKLKLKFMRHLRIAGVADIKGLLVAFLHGEYEPVAGVYALHFHGVTTKAKYEAMRRSLSGKWGYVKSASGAASIRYEDVNDRVYQLSYLLKSYWLAKAINIADGKLVRDRRGKRISEPFASIALLWLDRQSVTDVTVVTGGGISSSGQLRAG